MNWTSPNKRRYPDRRSMLAGALVMIAMVATAALGAGAPAEATDPSAAMDRAMDLYLTGRYAEAETMALRAATDPDRPHPRAWAVVAASRERLQRSAEAAEAWRSFLVACSGEEVRQYARERAMAATVASSVRGRDAAPPSHRLTSGQVLAFAEVAPTVERVSSEHFEVVSRNRALAKVVAEQAEVLLSRIVADMLGAADFPHKVTIRVHVAPREPLVVPGEQRELLHPGGSGRFTLQSHRLAPTSRTIDLVQLDAGGRFDPALLDNVLPHELCHVVIREWLGDAECPIALQEGLAMLAEADGQEARILQAAEAFADGSGVSLRELLATPALEGPRASLLYAQSLSLTTYLRDRLTREQFVQTLGHMKTGCDLVTALQRTLCVTEDAEFVASLEQAWRQYTIGRALSLSAFSSMATP